MEKDKIEKMEELLIFALPYMEMCADDPCYTDKGVKACKKWVRETRKILDDMLTDTNVVQ